MKRLFLYLILNISVISLLSCTHQRHGEKAEPIISNDLQENLVLINGLSNKYSWSETFLEKTLSIWGSGNVFVIYTNNSEIIYEKTIQSRTMVYCGEDNKKAGDKNIEEQTELLQRKIKLLQETKGLGKRFYIIAHSMGGLVARRYIYKSPDVVKGLVTLGTPHHGSPLADSFKWAGFFLGATDAIDNLRPSFLKEFNKRFPVKSSPLAENGKIYTIRGDCDGKDCFGWGGELLLGWTFITQTTDKDNDGLVPFDSAIIEGADHIWDFPDFDHFDLVQEPSVAEKASEYLIHNN
jgi:triacylglycerol lipase